MAENRTNANRNPIVIVGAGIAGLTAALRLAPYPVMVIANAPMGQGAASGWSQGGIAAALSAGDSAEDHKKDTIAAAAGIGNIESIDIITQESAAAIEYLCDVGVNFDKTQSGQFALSKEAAHGKARIVRVAGDLTGPGIMAALRKAVEAADSVTMKSGYEVVELSVEKNTIHGLWIADEAGNLQFIRTSAIIMATGGVGYLYRNTSNPPTACGEGIAVAARAGAVLADLEFVQFHPTTLAVGKDPSPLATEALRGEGAVLINGLGKRFMPGIHPDAELAPRDIVARAIFAEIQNTGKVLLDCTQAIGQQFPQKFPKVFELCQQAGIDPRTTPIPVEPAAHYHMGGIATDSMARTSVKGLWACGEVACSGAHGANRLASNSLLEAVVFAKRAVKDIKDFLASQTDQEFAAHPSPNFIAHTAADKKNETALRQIMRDHVGVIRNKGGLTRAIQEIESIEALPSLSQRLKNMTLVCKLIAAFSLWREESRGSQFREDFPTSSERWKKRQFYNLAECAERLNPQSPKPVRKSAAG